MGIRARLRKLSGTKGANRPAFGGLLCYLPAIGEGGVVSYLQVQVGEGESERSLLITDRRENERSKYI